MSDQTAGPQQRRIQFRRGAIDRADDVRAQEVGKHPVADVQDRADLRAVVVAPGHQRGLAVLEHHDKTPVATVPLDFLDPEVHEFRLDQGTERSRRQVVEAVRGGQLDHEHAQVARLARARRSFEERKTRSSFHDGLDKLLVPPGEILPVVEIQISLVRSGIHGHLDPLGAQAAVGGVDDVERRCFRSGCGLEFPGKPGQAVHCLLPRRGVRHRRPALDKDELGPVESEEGIGPFLLVLDLVGAMFAARQVFTDLVDRLADLPIGLHHGAVVGTQPVGTDHILGRNPQVAAPVSEWGRVACIELQGHRY